MSRFLPALFLCLFALPALADGSPVTISKAWSRVTTGPTGVVYLTITNTGAPDVLVAASTPVAAKAQLHETSKRDGVMHMQPVDALTVTSGQPITLMPGGYHLMLTGLTKPLAAGDTFPLLLTFAHAGPVATLVTVEKAGAARENSAMPGMDMPGMDMGH